MIVGFLLLLTSTLLTLLFIITYQTDYFIIRKLWNNSIIVKGFFTYISGNLFCIYIIVIMYFLKCPESRSSFIMYIFLCFLEFKNKILNVKSLTKNHPTRYWLRNRNKRKRDRVLYRHWEKQHMAMNYVFVIINGIKQTCSSLILKK